MEVIVRRGWHLVAPARTAFALWEAPCVHLFFPLAFFNVPYMSPLLLTRPLKSRLTDLTARLAQIRIPDKLAKQPEHNRFLILYKLTLQLNMHKQLVVLHVWIICLMLYQPCNIRLQAACSVIMPTEQTGS